MSTKSLFVPGKIWLKATDFINDFPQAKLPLVMLLADAILPYIDKRSIPSTCSFSTVKSIISLGIDQYTYNSKLNTYRDIIRYAMSPEQPLNINFQIIDLSNPENTYNQKLLPFICSFPEGDTCYSCISPTNAIPLLSLIQYEYMRQGEAIGLPGGVSLDKNYFYLCFKVNKDNIINDFANNGFKYFQIESPSEYKPFNEIYGISDISQVPANTISYVVVNQPPPVDSDIKWDCVEFWSALFKDNIGTSILSAVAKNMPISIRTTATNWKDPNLYLSQATTTEEKNTITHKFTYVWQDFEFQIDEKNSILVKYNRGIDTKEIVVQKTNAFMEILKGVGFLAAFVLATAAIGSALGQVSIFTPNAAVEAGTLSTVNLPGTTTPLTIAGGTATQSGLNISALGLTTPQLTGVGVVTGTGEAIASKTSVWTSILASAPKVAGAVATAGIGIYSAQKQADIQKALIESGYTSDAFKYMPDGKLADGSYVYSTEKTLFGMSYTQLAIIGGIATIAITLLLTGKKKEG